MLIKYLRDFNRSATDGYFVAFNKNSIDNVELLHEFKTHCLLKFNTFECWLVRGKDFIECN
jgi:hypothetical protein